jgi:putative FmdB family regulatory protein
VPIYEYICAKCGERTEAMRKMSDPPLTECPRCGGSLTKVMSSTSFILKGTGWYATDYAKKSNGGSNGKRADTKDRPKDIEPKKETPSTPEKSTSGGSSGSSTVPGTKE